MDDSEQAVMVYNELIDKLQLNIPKDVDYRPNIYSYFGIQKSQMSGNDDMYFSYQAF